MPFVKVRGIEIYHEARGSGPRVLFISGTGSDLRREPNVFDVPGIERLTICAYDHRLMGQSTITEPTLICGGKYDDIAPTARAEAMLNRLPDAEMKEFEGGHLFFMEDRSAWPAMMDFLLAG